MAYGTLFSSNGEVTFSVPGGRVVKSRSDWIGGPMPTRVDVDEWQRRYPGEDVTVGHDILDFGLWFCDTYYPPCESRRKGRETQIKNDPPHGFVAYQCAGDTLGELN